jgi:hypothetical protein
VSKPVHRLILGRLPLLCRGLSVWEPLWTQPAESLAALCILPMGRSWVRIAGLTCRPSRDSLRLPLASNVKWPLSFAVTGCYWPNSAPRRGTLAGPELSFGSATHKLPLTQNRWIRVNEHAVGELGWAYCHAIVCRLNVCRVSSEIYTCLFIQQPGSQAKR